MCASCAALTAENAALMERYQIVESGRYAAERQVAALKRELHGSTSPENKRVQEVCAYHDDLWHRVYPKAKGLTYPLDGVNAKAVRKVLRWGFKVEQIKEVLDGAFASDFHRKTPKYLYLSSVLGDENKIRNHLERIEKRKQDALKAEIEERRGQFWPPVDRVLLELRRLGIQAVKADGTLLDERRAWLFVAACPLCNSVLRVGQVFESRGACVECERGCDWWGLLDVLRLWPSDLVGPSDPTIPWAPLEDQPEQVAA